MRVIAGKAKGHPLAAPGGMNTRPITDKIKGALFNSWQLQIVDSKFLDIFAGSGSMGIEAISRGAEKVVFVEKNRGAVDIIKKNLTACKFTNGYKVYKDDVFHRIECLKTEGEQFDIIYLDPPFTVDEPGKSFLSFLPSLSGLPGSMERLSVADFLWYMQRKVILGLAEKGSCVIVGRCTDYILKDNPDAFHVFIHASTSFKADRIVRLYGESERKPEERLTDKDRRKSVHYKHFIGREWGKYQNYHLSLDSEKIGLDKCVSFIVDLTQQKTPE